MRRTRIALIPMSDSDDEEETVRNLLGNSSGDEGEEQSERSEGINRRGADEDAAERQPQEGEGGERGARRAQPTTEFQRRERTELLRFLRFITGGNEPVEDSNQSLVSSLKRKGHLTSPSVERALLACPRNLFVPAPYASEALRDSPLRIERLTRQRTGGTTATAAAAAAGAAEPRAENLEDGSASDLGEGFNISAPHMHAMTLEGLDIKPGDKVLDVGAGCGIVAACAAHMVGPTGEVLAVDIRRACAELTARNVRRLRERDSSYAEASCPVQVQHLNIFLHRAEHRGRFDKVHAGGAVAEVRVRELLPLLSPGGGRLLVPVDNDLRIYDVDASGAITYRVLTAVRFSDLESPREVEVLYELERARTAERRRFQTPDPNAIWEDVRTAMVRGWDELVRGAAAAAGRSANGGGGDSDTSKSSSPAAAAKGRKPQKKERRNGRARGDTATAAAAAAISPRETRLEGEEATEVDVGSGGATDAPGVKEEEIETPLSGLDEMMSVVAREAGHATDAGGGAEGGGEEGCRGAAARSPRYDVGAISYADAVKGPVAAAAGPSPRPLSYDDGGEFVVRLSTIAEALEQAAAKPGADDPGSSSSVGEAEEARPPGGGGRDEAVVSPTGQAKNSKRARTTGSFNAIAKKPANDEHLSSSSSSLAAVAPGAAESDVSLGGFLDLVCACCGCAPDVLPPPDCEMDLDLGGAGWFRFMAHRDILTARCDQPKAMFHSGMRDAATGRLRVPGEAATPAALAALLVYVYTDRIPLPEAAARLAAVARVSDSGAATNASSSPCGILTTSPASAYATATPAKLPPPPPPFPLFEAACVAVSPLNPSSRRQKRQARTSPSKSKSPESRASRERGERMDPDPDVDAESREVMSVAATADAEASRELSELASRSSGSAAAGYTSAVPSSSPRPAVHGEEEESLCKADDDEPAGDFDDNSEETRRGGRGGGKRKENVAEEVGFVGPPPPPPLPRPVEMREGEASLSAMEVDSSGVGKDEIKLEGEVSYTPGRSFLSPAGPECSLEPEPEEGGGGEASLPSGSGQHGEAREKRGIAGADGGRGEDGGMSVSGFAFAAVRLVERRRRQLWLALLPELVPLAAFYGCPRLMSLAEGKLAELLILTAAADEDNGSGKQDSSSFGAPSTDLASSLPAKQGPTPSLASKGPDATDLDLDLDQNLFSRSQEADATAVAIGGGFPSLGAEPGPCELAAALLVMADEFSLGHLWRVAGDYVLDHWAAACAAGCLRLLPPPLLERVTGEAVRRHTALVRTIEWMTVEPKSMRPVASTLYGTTDPRTQSQSGGSDFGFDR